MNEERLYDKDTSNFDTYRNDFQHDRDRILYSKAFRRLGYKTQVFTNSEGDTYRTRLTHSLEVAQIARFASFALKLNQDLAEAIALAHDLGHPPFAHAGQDILNDLMQGHGGFEHNCQGLRQITKLEMPYLNFPGLNLTRITLKGIMKRPRVYECDNELAPLVDERSKKPQYSEAILVDICDRLAYVHHDLEDGVDSGILKFSDLDQVQYWKEAWYFLKENNKKEFENARDPIRLRAIIRHIMNKSIKELIIHSLSKNNKTSKQIISLAPETKANIEELYSYLKEKLYQAPSVIKMSERGQEIITKLFSYFLKSPDKMPRQYQDIITKDGLERSVTDYIAGMTDRFAEKTYEEL